LRKDGDVQKDWKSVDAVVIDGEVTPALQEKLKILLDVPTGVICRPGNGVPDGATLLYDAASVTEALPERLGGYAVAFNGRESAAQIKSVMDLAEPRFIFLKPETQDAVTFVGRRFFSILQSEHVKPVPCMLWFQYPAANGDVEDDVIVKSSAEYGSLFVDGIGEGMLWDAELLDAELLRESSFNLLQASRMRISKTEFISCPSCGRTLFDLQTTTAKIQERTGHLPGVRIAVMGCIVNGPGEMADADFGYVGSGVGKIDLYVGYECVQRAIPSESAVEALVDLIKEHGRWQEPASEDDDE